MAWSMLKSKNMPKEIWAEEMPYVVYVQSQCAHAKLANQTLQEA